MPLAVREAAYISSIIASAEVPSNAQVTARGPLPPRHRLPKSTGESRRSPRWYACNRSSAAIGPRQPRWLQPDLPSTRQARRSRASLGRIRSGGVDRPRRAFRQKQVFRHPATSARTLRPAISRTPPPAAPRSVPEGTPPLPRASLEAGTIGDGEEPSSFPSVRRSPDSG